MHNAKTVGEGDVVLRDGSTVRIRVMRPSDEAGLCALLTSLSEESRWLRFYCLQSSAGIAAEAHTVRIERSVPQANRHIDTSRGPGLIDYCENLPSH